MEQTQWGEMLVQWSAVVALRCFVCVIDSLD